MFNFSNQDRQFLDLLEKVSQSIFVTNNFQFLFVNPKAIDFFACGPDIYQKQFSDFINSEDLQIFLNRQDLNADEQKMVLRIKNGSNIEKWVEISSVPIIWEDKKAILNFIVDITVQKETEEHLQSLKKTSEETDRLKSFFLANMSHEIRTPLNAIIGFSQLLSQDDVPEELRLKYYNLIDNNSNQLLELIDDIIDLSKIEAGEMALNNSYFSINEVIKELELNFNESILHNKDNSKVKLVTKLPVKTDGVFISSDRQRVLQVFNNLLSNAIKFTKSGQITIGYRVLDRYLLEFYVKDTGVGIPLEKQTIIFDRFQQLNLFRNTKSKGTGLGLTISQNLVNLLGGKLTVQSVFGKGSTFTFTLPYKSEDKQPHILKAKKNIPAFIDWSEKTILLAEDEESNYFFIKEILRKTKVQLLWAEDGEKAIELLKSAQKVDLILMDIRMPVMDGYETLIKIKELGFKLPIIAQTAYAMIEEKEKIRSAGFDNYISKPIQINLLLEMISSFLSK